MLRLAKVRCLSAGRTEIASPREISQRELGTSPFASRLVTSHRPNRVRYPTDWPFTSCCSPPRLATTQLQSVTSYVDLGRTFTSLTKCAFRRTSAGVPTGDFLELELVGPERFACPNPALRQAQGRGRSRQRGRRELPTRGFRASTVRSTSCGPAGHHLGSVRSDASESATIRELIGSINTTALLRVYTWPSAIFREGDLSFRIPT